MKSMTDKLIEKSDPRMAKMCNDILVYAADRKGSMTNKTFWGRNEFNIYFLVIFAMGYGVLRFFGSGISIIFGIIFLLLLLGTLWNEVKLWR